MPAAGGRPTLHLACSSGGHIDLLMRLRPVLGGFDLVWVTQPSRRASELIEQGARVILLPEYSRDPRESRLPQTLARSAAACAGSSRPRLVVTSGSGLVVPFCVFARATGARLVFIETAARVRNPSRAGRVLSRAAHRTIVQWEPMLDLYPRSRLALSSVLESVCPRPAATGRGTFVGVGTHIYPFDRLLRIVDEAAERGLLPEPILAQTGVSTYRPRNFEARDWMEPAAIEQAVAGSRLVITHGGSGLISAALGSGRRPLVLARRADLREHFDGHQEQIVGELQRLGLVVRLNGAITPHSVAAADAPLPDPRSRLDAPPLGEVLSEELEVLLN